MANWDLETLNKYINSSGFTKDYQVDAVLKSLKSKQIIDGFLDTAAGSLLISSTVDGITQNMMSIISNCVSGSNDHWCEIEKAAMQINAAHEFLFFIKKILEEGKTIEKNLDKIQKGEQ